MVPALGLLHKYILVNTYIHTYIHAYIHTYTHTYTHTYIHPSIHPYIHTCIHTYIHTYIHRQKDIHSPCCGMRNSPVVGVPHNNSFPLVNAGVGRPVKITAYENVRWTQINISTRLHIDEHTYIQRYINTYIN